MLRVVQSVNMSLFVDQVSMDSKLSGIQNDLLASLAGPPGYSMRDELLSYQNRLVLPLHLQIFPCC